MLVFRVGFKIIWIYFKERKFSQARVKLHASGSLLDGLFWMAYFLSSHIWMDGSLLDWTCWDASLMDRSLLNRSLFADPLLCYIKMKSLGSGHIPFGSMRRLENNCMGRGHTYTQTDIVTYRLNRPKCPFGVKVTRLLIRMASLGGEFL